MSLKTATCGFVAWCCCQAGLMAITVGTFNIRYDNPGDQATGNAWPQRAPVIANLIRFHDFDVIATEEGLPHQMEDLKRLLPEYTCSSHGRDDGKLAGEHIGIFFKTDHYELQDSGVFWLSETPEKPGKGWDAALPRICGWTKLKAKASQKTFYYFGLHLDHRGSEARHQSVGLVMRKIDEIAGDDPVFLVGDFNTDQNSGTYRLLAASPKIADSCGMAKVRFILNGTANRFDPDSHTDSRIDHVFVSKTLKVRRFGVLTDSYRVAKSTNPAESTSGNFPTEVKFQNYEARLPSDHFPVLVEVEDW